MVNDLVHQVGLSAGQFVQLLEVFGKRYVPATAFISDVVERLFHLPVRSAAELNGPRNLIVAGFDSWLTGFRTTSGLPHYVLAEIRCITGVGRVGRSRLLMAG